MRQRLWLIPAGGALLAPLVTWLPMLAAKWPWLGLPPYEAARGIDIWHMQAFWLVVFCLVALLVGQRDPWLAVGLFTLGWGVFFWGGLIDVTHRVVFLGGCLALWALRQMPSEWKPMVVALLAASGAFQVMYVLQQLLGYDLLWGPMVGGVLKPHLQPLGTLGTVDATAAYIAITMPLMPPWLLPVAAGCVLKSHSITAIAAMMTGLLVAYHRNWRLTTALVTITLALVTWTYRRNFMYGVAVLPSTVSGKLGIWWFGLKDWAQTNPIHGPGVWAQRIPALQLERHYQPTGEIFLEAHNEYLQWLYETGATGFALLCGWIWAHRQMFRDAMVGGSLAAVTVAAGGFFTFHVVSVGLLGLVLIGLATTSDTQEATPCGV